MARSPRVEVESAAWARRQFGQAPLPDDRLRRRLPRVAAALAARPEVSMPQQHPAWSELLAAYRFLNNPRVTPEAIGRPAQERTRRACADAGLVLCLHDLTDLTPVYELSDTTLQQHTVLAVAADDGTLLGLRHQHWFDDPKTPPGETRAQRRERWRRSQTWADAITAVGPASAGGRFVHVADREADDFQTFTACAEQGRGFVIRSQHDRELLGDPRRLRAHLAAQPVGGCLTLEVAGHAAASGSGPRTPLWQQRNKQAARRAKLEVRWAQVTLAPPARDARYTQGVPVHAVWLREVDPPADVAEPIDWLLLSSESVTCLDQALAVRGWYERRWMIEEFHKAQKTGCRLEATQLRSAAAFTCLAALCAVVAVRLLQLRDAAQDPARAAAPALGVIDPTWVRVVSRLAKHADPATLTLGEFYRAVARRGGWLGRKHDGQPGWQTLWRGWRQIADYVTGIQLYLGDPAGP